MIFLFLKGQDYIAECPQCRQGVLIPVQNKEHHKFLLICDDCESQWADPESVIQGLPPLVNEEKNLEDVSMEELEKIGWTKYIRKPFSVK